jgi:hypothetical protein
MNSTSITLNLLSKLKLNHCQNDKIDLANYKISCCLDFYGFPFIVYKKNTFRILDRGQSRDCNESEGKREIVS